MDVQRDFQPRAGLRVLLGIRPVFCRLRSVLRLRSPIFGLVFVRAASIWRWGWLLRSRELRAQLGIRLLCAGESVLWHLRGWVRQRLRWWELLGMWCRDGGDRTERFGRLRTDARWRCRPRVHAADLRPCSRPLPADDAERRFRSGQSQPDRPQSKSRSGRFWRRRHRRSEQQVGGAPLRPASSG